MSAALRAYDAGADNGLLAVLSKAWSVEPEEMVRMANAAEPRFAELASHVVEAADKGNTAARDITTRAGKALADSVAEAFL